MYFPDFFHPKAEAYWKKEVGTLTITPSLLPSASYFSLSLYIYIYIIVVYCFSAIWNNSNIYIFITLQLSDFMNNLANVDGIWIDMNECANFCDGFCSEDQATKYEPDSTSSSTSRPLDPRNPPYHINNRCSKQPLSTRTLPVEATQHGGILQYNAHSLYGELHFLTY